MGTSSAPWSRIHIDYAGPKDDYYYFIIIDAYSGWPEIFVSKNAPTSTSTIDAIKRVFSRFGLPLTIASENATIVRRILIIL